MSDRPVLLQLRGTFLLLTILLITIAMMALHLGVWTVATGQAATIPPILLTVSGASLVSIMLLIIPFHHASRGRAEV